MAGLMVPSQVQGTIAHWHVGDIMTFINHKVTGHENAAHTMLTMTFDNNQTVSWGLTDQQANTTFKFTYNGNRTIVKLVPTTADVQHNDAPNGVSNDADQLMSLIGVGPSDSGNGLHGLV